MTPYIFPGTEKIIIKDTHIEKIKWVVADHCKISIFDYDKKSRLPKYVKARQIAHFFSRLLTDLSTTQIGQSIGNKDHSTIIHSIKTVNNLRSVDKCYDAEIKEIERRLL